MGAACSCTERSQEPEKLPNEDEFVADNTLLRAQTVGLVFRKSMDLEDRCNDEFVLWGYRVRGYQVDSLWVKVGKRYVPMFLNDVPVLTRLGAGTVSDAGVALAEMHAERTVDIFTLDMLSREMETEENTPASTPRAEPPVLSAAQIFSEPAVPTVPAAPTTIPSGFPRDAPRRLSVERSDTATFGDAAPATFGAERKQCTAGRLVASGFCEAADAKASATQAEARPRSETPPAKVDGKKRKKDKSKTPPRSRDDRGRTDSVRSPGRGDREKGPLRGPGSGSKIAMLRERITTAEGRQSLRAAQDAESAGQSAESALEQADRAVAEAEAQRASKKRVSRSRVQMLQKTMNTAEGRQMLRAAEGPDVEVSSTPSTVALHPPPVERIGESKWHIKGMYEHQVLRLGLRLLDKEWDDASILELPRDKDGKMVLFRPTLFTRLLDGSVKLQSVTGNDISAAQPDLRRLSLRQLLRIRVSHLDFVPSGCGADSVTAVGGTHQAFLSTLDGLLFQQLGQMALGEVAPAWMDTEPGQAHRLGREAVLLVAAASAVLVPPRWAWWLRDDCRVFFHVGRFASESTFPSESEGGVLEVLDCSKRDQHEPTGRLRWLDWRVELVTLESQLSPERPRLPGAEPSGAPRGRTATGGTDKSSQNASPRHAPDSSGAISPDVGSGTADLFSVEVLQSKRGQLKKTGAAVS